MPTLYSLRDVADQVGRDTSTVSRHVAKLGVGSRFGAAVALTAAEAEQVRRSIAAAKPGNPNAARDGAAAARKRARLRKRSR